MRERTERTLYREEAPWPSWVRALYWGSVGLTCFAILAGWDTGLPLGVRTIVAAAVAGTAALLGATVGGLTVLVRESHVLVHLGRFPLIERRVPYGDVVSVEAVRYHPVREFGGWGVRGTSRRRVWSARGDRAVSLELSDGRQLLIGSDHPQRLEERIRSAGREALADWGSRGPHRPRSATIRTGDESEGKQRPCRDRAAGSPRSRRPSSPSS